ncbi:beta-ketoacyl synthase [Leptospira broomii serovar Hurstbridge str. 5399]|uniref:Beta-ketoacyl synthase n=1 Tax=Leptospira broomii serovar Hurstbridge str. 5399 TaxID=1049789 RepID=T0EY87_9LEPT|nr:type I polyketide synthase [Leptospira broomii]EQA43810.1 beta-ketoacyl synthase [Leptospira broomii serovar Hurstbridge str. 5399]
MKATENKERREDMTMREDARDVVRNFLPEDVRISVLFAGQGNNPLPELMSLYETEGDGSEFFQRLYSTLGTCMSQVQKEGSGFLFPEGFDLRTWLLDPDAVPKDLIQKSSLYSVPLVFAAQAGNLFRFLRNESDWKMFRSKTAGIYGHSQGIFAGLLLSSSPNREIFLDNFEKTFSALFFLIFRAQIVYPEMDVDPEVLRRFAKKGEIPFPMAQMRFSEQVDSLQEVLYNYNTFVDSSDRVFLCLINGPSDRVFGGSPEALLKFRDYLSRSGHDGVRTWNFISASIPFHSPFLVEVPKMVEADFARIGFSPRLQDLEIALYDTRKGEDMRTLSSTTNLANDLASMVAHDLLDWNRTLSSLIGSEGKQLLLSFGPGNFVEKLSAPFLKGRSFLVKNLTQEERFRAFLKSDSFSFPLDWKDYAVTFGKLADGREFPLNRYSRWTGRPPVFGGGMTPSTVEPEIVIAAAKEGYVVEWAGGGQVTEELFRKRLELIRQELPPGKGIIVNLLYLDAYLWNLQVPLVKKCKSEGAPIDGVTISAGIPEPDEAVRLLEEFSSLGIWLNSFKPGTVDQIQKVLRIADKVPHITFMMQIEGGAAGGHHSWEDLEDLVQSTYGEIRKRSNLILAVGGGIGSPEDSALWLSGDWDPKNKKPVDAVFLGTRLMAAKECKTSLAIKKELVRKSGDADWLKTKEGKDVGGVVSGKSGLGADIYYASNTWTKLSELAEKITKGKEPKEARRNVLDHKAELIELINRTAKPYFGDIDAMSYNDVLERFVELTCPGERLRSSEGDWPDHPFIDFSFRTRLQELFLRFEGRLLFPVKEVESLLQRIEDLDDPNAFLIRWRKTYPIGNDLFILPEDREFFLEVCKRPGKPVNFIPILDEDLVRWIRSDSLWYSHCIDMDPNSCPWIPGPRALVGLLKENEPVSEILKSFVNGLKSEVEPIKIELWKEFLPRKNSEPLQGVEFIRSESKTEAFLPSLEFVQKETWIAFLSRQGEGMISALLACARINGKVSDIPDWFSPSLCRKFSWRVADSGELIELCAYKEGDTLPSVTLRLLGKKSAELTLFFSHPQDHDYIPFNRRFTAVDEPDVLFLEDGEFRSESIRSFYSTVWKLGNHQEFAHSIQFPLYSNGSYKEKKNERAIERSEIVDFRKATNDYFRKDFEEGRDLFSSLSMGAVFAWKEIIGPLFSFPKADLFRLLHLSQNFTWKPSAAGLKVGDLISSSARISSVEKLADATAVYVSGEIWNREVSVASFETGFLLRGLRVDFASFDSRQKEEGILVSSLAKADVLRQISWIRKKSDSTEILQGDVLRFQTQKRLSVSEGKETRHEIEGIVYRIDKLGNKSIYADFIINEKTVGTETSSLDRIFQVFESADSPIPLKKKYKLVSEVFRAPNDMSSYSAASQDANPIHTDPNFARFGGWERPIVHGLWTSSQVTNILVRFACGGDSSRLVSLKETFEAPVYLNEELRLDAFHVAQSSGNQVIEISLQSKNGETKLKAEALVSPAKTSYVFTGQGSQSQGMGMKLLEEFPEAREIWTQAEHTANSELGFSLLEIVRNNPTSIRCGGRDWVHPKGVLHLTQFTQVALVAKSLADWAILKKRGYLVPDSPFAGHSLGEFSALAARGFIGSENVFKIVYNRGFTMQRLVPRDAAGKSNYAMSVVLGNRHVGLNEAKILELVNESKKETGLHLEVVNYNIRDKQYSVTGHIEALELLEAKSKKFAKGKKTTIRLEGIDVPFHSRILFSGVPDFRATLEQNIPSDLPLRDLDGKYIPNLVAIPFSVSKEFLQTLMDVSGSEYISALLKKNPEELDSNEVRRTILIELLAYQFAMPVQWIRTQEVFFGELGINRLIDVGARGDLSGMARQTLKDRTDSSKFQILHLEENRDEVFYEKEDVPDAEWSVQIEEAESLPEESKSSTSVEHNVSVPPVVKEEVIIASHNGSSLEIPNVTLDRKDALFSLLSLKAGVRVDEISESGTVDDLFGGNSSKRNQALADIGSEFRTNALEGAHEKPLKDFIQVLADRMPYEQPGPYLRSAFEETVKKFFPPEFGRKEIFQHLKEERMLSEGGVFAVSIYLPLAARDGESLGKGALSSIGLKSRLTGAKESVRWLDQAVDLFSSWKKVQIPKRSAFSSSGGGGAKVDAAALEALERKYFGLEGAFAKSIRDLRRRLLEDDPYSEYLIHDLSKIEEGRSVLDKSENRILPIFSEKKIVSFKNSHQWAKKRILAIAAQFLKGEIREFSKEDTLYFGNHSDSEILDILEYWKVAFGKKADKSVLSDERKRFENANLQFSRLKDRLSERIDESPIFVYPRVVHRPDLRDGENGSLVCDDEEVELNPAVSYSRFSFLESSEDFGSTFERNEAGTKEYSKILNDLCLTGISFSGKKVLVTGAGPGSIASEIVKAFLLGGADVVLTTSSYSSDRIGFYKKLYQRYGAKNSSLQVVPFSQGSFADIRSLADWLDSKNWIPDFLFPFAAIGEENTASALDDTSLLSIRIMLVGVEKLIGELGKRRVNFDDAEHKLNVILPLSPNHGIFGRDGMYAETKLGLETLFRKKFSEAADWGRSVRILGGVIGWVRGTGLMEANDLLAPILEDQTGMRTFSRSEMGFLLIGLAGWSMRNGSLEVVKADLTGNLRDVKNLGERLAKIRAEIIARNKHTTEIQNISSTLYPTRPVRKVKPIPKQGLAFPEAPNATDLEEFKQTIKTDLSKLVCVVGYSELGPGGSSLTRWDLEKFGTLSLEASLEMAWMMGYIQYRTGEKGKVWTDVKTGEEIQEWEVKEKYESEILKHSGIRIVEVKSSGFDPTEISVFADVVLEEDFYIPVSSSEEAEEFRKAEPEITEIYNNQKSEKWFIKRKKGSVLKIRKASAINRKIAGQIPDGWDPEKYGIPKDLIRQVDMITIFNLYCTCEAYLRAGLDPFELFETVHPSQVGTTVGSGMGGMKMLKRLFLDYRLGDERQHDALQEALINVTAAWAVTSYAGIYGTMQTPVAACATGGISIELARDTILSGKAKFMIAGAFDDIAEESMIGFGDMNATANSEEMAEHGIEPSSICRPNDIRRNGFLESQGGGIILLSRGDIALQMGLPVYGIVGFAASRTDGIQSSIPAPGIGLLSLAADSETESSPLKEALLDFGLSADDIALVYKHDTSTKANDKNENRLLHTLMRKLGRTPGNSLAVVSQKSLTGHPKAGAAVWQTIGLLQSLEEGVISGNRNLEDVDSDMNVYSSLSFTDETISFGKNFWKAGMLSTLGFGHIGALVLLLHRNFFWVSLNEDEKREYLKLRKKRENYAGRRYNEIRLGTGVNLYEKKTHSFVESDQEESVLLDASFRVAAQSTEHFLEESKEHKSAGIRS